MRYEPIGTDRFRAFDPSISRCRIAAYKHVPSWESVMIHCLQNGDNEAAQFIKDINERSADLFEVMKSQIPLVRAIDAGKKVA